ncbi:MAG: hypothetical protein ACREBG_14870, partial [Pyrinomonadaceae bacterium]
ILGVIVAGVFSSLWIEEAGLIAFLLIASFGGVLALKFSARVLKRVNAELQADMTKFDDQLARVREKILANKAIVDQ